MRIPINEIDNYLNTDEMYETTQEQLNNAEMVEHEIIGCKSQLSITAHLNCDFDIKWSVFKDFKVQHDEVAFENLESTLKYIDG